MIRRADGRLLKTVFDGEKTEIPLRNGFIVSNNGRQNRHKPGGWKTERKTERRSFNIRNLWFVKPYFLYDYYSLRSFSITHDILLWLLLLFCSRRAIGRCYLHKKCVIKLWRGTRDSYGEEHDKTVAKLLLGCCSLSYDNNIVLCLVNKKNNNNNRWKK